ncbi:MAG: c-type cytochrome [Parasphingopyxis sp.]|uniref:c-type cytochrome n=1 Tax=Parasphingopyxis sp. TaxID=1920299 RepID=UPI003FA054BD
MRRFAPWLPAIVLTLALAAAAPGRAQSPDGARLYQQRCGGCHSLDADRVGPRHRGLIGRRAGAVRGFRYSPALARSDIVWTRTALERWLRGPRAMVRGTTMGFSLSDPAERRAIIDYLASED